MASLSELLTNFKTLMHQYFPYTTEVNTSLNGKVDKETGKGLSTNDYTTTEKDKLAGLSNYTHPSAKQCNASIPTANTTNSNIKMDGTQSAGSLSTFAKADHVHPTDTSRAASSHNHTKSNITDFRSTEISIANDTSGHEAYNPQIDDTVTLTITLKDGAGNAVSGENVTVNCNKGYFTKYNNTSISGTSTKTKTGTTNSSGQFTLTYKCSEWGIINFSANNHNAQLQIKGFKEVYSYGGIKIRTDGIYAELSINTEYQLNSNKQLMVTFDSKYSANMIYLVPYNESGSSTGKIMLQNNNVYLTDGATGFKYVYTALIYKLDTQLY